MSVLVSVLFEHKTRASFSFLSGSELSLLRERANGQRCEEGATEVPGFTLDLSTTLAT